MVLGHLSQVIPAKAAPAGVVDGVPLDDVVRSEREGITPAPVEGIRRSLAVGQNDRTRQEVDLASDRLLREPEADQTSRVQFSPEGLEEAIGSRGHRIRTHRFQIELVPGSQVTLAPSLTALLTDQRIREWLRPLPKRSLSGSRGRSRTKVCRHGERTSPSAVSSSCR